MSKIIFTYILGYKVDIGHMEAVNLISSHKYSEKQIVCLLETMMGNITDSFIYIGLPCSNAFDARELRISSPRREFDKERLRR